MKKKINKISKEIVRLMVVYHIIIAILFGIVYINPGQIFTETGGWGIVAWIMIIPLVGLKYTLSFLLLNIGVFLITRVKRKIKNYRE